MKKTALLFWVLIFGSAVSLWSAQVPDWQELKSEHFIIYYTTGDDRFVREVADKSEAYYREIATSLGYPRYKEFWLWEKRVKIYIYPDRKSFLAGANQPDWSEGVADYLKKSISTHTGSEDFLRMVLPHEIAHLIFRDFVGFKGEVPLWLDEGVAQWAEKGKKERVRTLVRQLYMEDKLLSMKDMMLLNMRILKEKDSVFIRPTRTRTGEATTLVLSTEHLINIYYIQAVSLVDFLIQKYGSDAFARFCRELRDGKTTEGALKSTYPDYIHSLEELDGRWRRYLEEV